MPERICKTACYYAGRQVKIGDQFHVDQADVELMLVAGLIEVERPPEAIGHVARDMAAASSGVYRAEAMAAKPKRAYHRKAA